MTVRALAVLCVAAFLAGACGGGAEPANRMGNRRQGEPTPTEAQPPKLPGASCKGRGGGAAGNTPDFVGVKVGSRDGVDRIEFLFRPREAVNAPPSHYVRFSDQLLTEGEGRPAQVDGRVYVVVVFGAFGSDPSGGQPVQLYTGPTEFTPGFGTVLEVEQLGDFEATITWAIGLSRRTCFRLEAAADRLVLEFPSA